MTALRAMGVWVGVADNQTSRAGGILRRLDLPADLIATSEDWGAAKPEPLVLPRAYLGGTVRG
jgi:beta-phosphoglucomutase-like phosphatase (HAD superfamily)